MSEDEEIVSYCIRPHKPDNANKCPRGELIVNGGMENINDNKPTDWAFINPLEVKSIDAQGRVHSGNLAVNIHAGSSIYQTVYPNNIGGCYYRLSFFARGNGSQVGFIASVVFETPNGAVTGGTINVREQDITTSNREFAFYELITTQAPDNTTGITVQIMASSTEDESLDVDDISLIAI